MVGRLHLCDTVPEVRMLQSLCTSEAGGGARVQDSAKEGSSCIWCGAGCPHIVQ